MKKSQYIRKNNLRTWIEVDTRAFAHNLKSIKKQVREEAKILVVVKSNAYGHGLVGAARGAAYAGADWLGVDSLEEALELKKAKLGLPLLILGYVPLSRLTEIVRGGFRLGTYRQDILRVLNQIARREKRIVRIHLKIETGTARQGVRGDDMNRIIREIKKSSGVHLEGIYSHFADSEDASSGYWKKQRDRFHEAIRTVQELGFPRPITHIASSAGAILYPEAHFDMVRLGLAFYGFWPSSDVQNIGVLKGIHLEPALSWKTRIAQIKSLSKGTPIGYGLSERLKRSSRVAVLPVGYWDGFDRKLSRIGEVLVRGKRCRVLGRVCMNMTMVDVTDVKGAAVDEVVTLIGESGREEVSADEIAKKIGTINYEVVTRINSTIPRIFL